MRTEIRIINGKQYVLTTATDEGKNWVAVNGIPAEKVYYNHKIRTHFAAFSFSEGNFWFTVYNNKPRLLPTKGSLNEESFLKEFGKKAFPFPLSVLYVLFVLALPTICGSLLVPNLKSLYLLFLCVATFYYLVINQVPLASRKVRRIMTLWNLGFILIGALLGLLFI